MQRRACARSPLTALAQKTVIAKNLFASTADFPRYAGLTVRHSHTGAVGRIDSLFGQTGKFKVVFPNGIGDDAKSAAPSEPARLELEFKVFAGDKHADKQSSDKKSSKAVKKLKQ